MKRTLCRSPTINKKKYPHKTIDEDSKHDEITPPCSPVIKRLIQDHMEMPILAFTSQTL